MHNHMVGRAASVVSPFYSILLGPPASVKSMVQLSPPEKKKVQAPGLTNSSAPLGQGILFFIIVLKDVLACRNFEI